MAADGSRVNVLKELLFLHMQMGDDLVFHDITSHSGRVSPYRQKVSGLVSVRVSDQVVAFHSRRVTKKTSGKILGEPVNLPRRSLSRLEERSVELTTEMRGEEGSEKKRLTPNTMVVAIDGVEHDFVFRVDDDKVLTIEPKGEDIPFEVTYRPLQISIYFRSPNPKIDRMVAVHYIGGLNRRAGEMENTTRAAALVLKSLLGLREFSAVAGIVDVNTPRAPEAAPVAPKRAAGDRIVFPITVNLWDDGSGEMEHLGTETVNFEVNLDNADRTNRSLMYSLIPDAAIEPHLEDFREALMKMVSGAVLAYLPASEQADLVDSINMGLLGETDLERIRESVTGLPDVNVSKKALWGWAETA